MGVLNFLGIENLRDATALVTSFKKARKEQVCVYAPPKRLRLAP